MFYKVLASLCCIDADDLGITTCEATFTYPPKMDFKDSDYTNTILLPITFLLNGEVSGPKPSLFCRALGSDSHGAAGSH